jgi:hypothetical protein
MEEDWERGLAIPIIRGFDVIAAAREQLAGDIKLASRFGRAHCIDGTSEQSGDQEGEISHICQARDHGVNVTSRMRGASRCTLPRPPMWTLALNFALEIL